MNYSCPSFLISVLRTTSKANRLDHEGLPWYLLFSQMSPIQCSLSILLYNKAILRFCSKTQSWDRQFSLGLRPFGSYGLTPRLWFQMFSPKYPRSTIRDTDGHCSVIAPHSLGNVLPSVETFVTYSRNSYVLQMIPHISSSEA